MTWVVGALETAAAFNTQFRDNFLFLSSPPRVKVRGTPSQSIPTGVNTAITATGADSFDSDNMHSPTVNPSRITASTAGLYQFSGCVSFGPSATGARTLYWAKNGVTVDSATTQTPGNAYSYTIVAPTKYIYLAVGDYVELFVNQASGAAMTITNGLDTDIAARWVSTS